MTIIRQFSIRQRFILLLITCLLTLSACGGGGSSQGASSSTNAAAGGTGASNNASQQSSNSSANNSTQASGNSDNSASASTGNSASDQGNAGSGQGSNQSAQGTSSGTTPGQKFANAKPALPGALLVMIENHPKARPVSGLNRADLVYEAVAEWGITRFLAVFYHQAAAKIGPVRSARFYYVDIAKAYKSPYAHAGGNEDALNLIKKINASEDMDEIINAGPYFWRSSDRKMPHNLYTSTRLLLKGARKKGEHLSQLKPLPTGSVAGGSNANRVDIQWADYPSYKYLVSWRYQPSKQRYQRFENGDHPAVTQDGSDIYADNLIIIYTHSQAVDVKQWGKTVSEMDTRVIGSGDATFLVNGKLYKGQWKKSSASSQFEYSYQGQPMKFAPGQTWVEIVPRDGKEVRVTYPGSGQ